MSPTSHTVDGLTATRHGHSIVVHNQQGDRIAAWADEVPTAVIEDKVFSSPHARFVTAGLATLALRDEEAQAAPATRSWRCPACGATWHAQAHMRDVLCIGVRTDVPFSDEGRHEAIPCVPL